MMTASELDILLVEDNPVDAELVLLALRSAKLGSHVQVVNDGEEALDFILCQGAYSGRPATELPKVVLLDLKLPRLDGLEVLRQIRSDPRFQALPVVIFTSSLEEKDRARGYDLGANSYIQKPVDYERFRQKVSQVALYWLGVNRIPPAVGAA